VKRHPTIVVLGLLTDMPVAGPIWGTLHYLLGLERLGYETYYVEAHRITPRQFMQHPEDDGPGKAAAFLARVMERFGFGDRWAYQSVLRGRRTFGLSEKRLRRLYLDADVIINLHGGTDPLPEHCETGRLAYLETDPVWLELGLARGDDDWAASVSRHRAFSTWGLNYGEQDCTLPMPEKIPFHRAPPPILTDLWEHGLHGRDVLTTVGHWQLKETDQYWNKNAQFLRFLELPGRTTQRLELALATVDDDDRNLLEDHGWEVRPAEEVSADVDAYRTYIKTSRGEFTVAKDLNVRFRTGWFSERSAAYLAAGKPVITQDTGFGSYLPTGQGLFGFTTMEEILTAIDTINSDYRRHGRAASALAREFLDANVVLPGLLEHFGVDPARRPRSKRPAPLAQPGGRDG
jgi:hypothetical protein